MVQSEDALQAAVRCAVRLPTPCYRTSRGCLRSLGAARASTLASLTWAGALGAATVALGLLLTANSDLLELSLFGGLLSGLRLRVLAAAGAGTDTGSARALARVGGAVALGARWVTLHWMVLSLALLHGSQVLGLIVNIQDLLLSLLVERADLLTGRRVGGLFKVRGETRPCLVALGGDGVLLVDGLSALSDLVLGVEVGQGVLELGADAVLLVEGKSTLDGLVADDVSVGQHLGGDAGAGLVLLCDFLAILVLLVGRAGRLAACELVERLCGGNVDDGGAELGVVEQERGLSGGLLLESHRRRLGRAGIAGVGLDGDGLDLAAVLWSVNDGCAVHPGLELTRKRRSP